MVLKKLFNGKSNFNYDMVNNVFESLDYEEIEWLYECCCPIIYELRIQESKEINKFFERHGCKLYPRKGKYGILLDTIYFAEEKWFITKVFDEYKKSGGEEITQKHYNAIENYKL